MVATDNASYADMVFGLVKILGHNFSPRFRDLDDQRFWRATMPGVQTGTCGAVEDLAPNRVNPNKVITHWPDMLKVAGSLVTNQVRAYDLLRMFGGEGGPTPLGTAFAEYGRVAKLPLPERQRLLSEPSAGCQSADGGCRHGGRAILVETSKPPGTRAGPRGADHQHHRAALDQRTVDRLRLGSAIDQPGRRHSRRLLLRRW
ncbi:hypothetical protein GCM10010238_39980 [Streptomyces griseoviridis]|uniref:Tn3 transposase DDE domain-containing protein n=1 Tax=Streptomyces griseoviridis TaxID=45398 RepID=A0A918LGB5_STRGD|nr:Tn3 family transposase [Streptomyces niveoruber]GGS46224.1 hypothetical protein GCM10010238_39980 [Streptomyces niveoruber]